MSRFRAWPKSIRSILTAVAVLCCLVSIPFLAQVQWPTNIAAGTPPYPLYSLSGATGWINSKPLTAKDLKGKVVLIDFWAYSCINCLRAMPYVEAWSKKYKDHGLVVIGVHTPEFDFGQERANVEGAIQRFGITFPVALDSKHKIWNAFHNEYWPADYFIDATGKVRYKHFGEGDYDQSERWIQKLLEERSKKERTAKGQAANSMPGGMVQVDARGVEEAADMSQIRSPETYIGYARAERFASPGGLHRDSEHLYTAPRHPNLNEWGLVGQWADHAQEAVLNSAGGKIVFHFQARDLHLVMGPAADGKPIHFRVTIDGHAPGDNHGVDTDAAGNGVVTGYRLYQLIRQKGPVKNHVFTIEFEEPGVQAFSFTFG